MTDRSTDPVAVATWRRRAALALNDVDASADGALEADLLLAHALEQTRSWLFAHGDDTLDEAVRYAADALLADRLAGEPIAYQLGEQGFRSRTFAIDARVLVPRDDTEVLVDAALAACRAMATAGRSLSVVDAGTGSGIVAISVALESEVDCHVTGLDVSLDALRLAASNAAVHRCDARFVTSDWLSALATDSVDVLAANPPYIRRDDAHLASLAREPALALVSGSDGLDALTQLIDDGRRVVRRDGRLLLEHGHDQAAAVTRLLERAGYTRLATHRDGGGRDRVSEGVAP